MKGNNKRQKAKRQVRPKGRGIELNEPNYALMIQAFIHSYNNTEFKEESIGAGGRIS